MAAYFIKKYGEAGYKKMAEMYPAGSIQLEQFNSPFMRLTALQAPGAPVEIKVLAPQGEDIKMPLVGKGGKAGQRYYRFWNRRLELRGLSGYGDSFILCDGKNKAGCLLDRKGMTLSWTPTQDKKRFYAPKVLEIVLAYNMATGVIIDGKKHGSEQKGTAKARIAWLALPACGQDWGDGEVVNCPSPPGPRIVWQARTLGPVNLAVPSNWSVDMGPDGISCKYQFGKGRPPLAGFLVLRQEGAEQMLKGLSDIKKSEIAISGRTAKVHAGKVNGGIGKVIIFKEPLSDGKPLTLSVASAQPKKYQALLDAALASVKLDQGQAALPAMAAGEQAAPLPELGNATITHVAADNTLPAAASPSAAPGSQPTEKPKTDTGKSTARLVRLNGFGDYAGRSEAPRGDGSADAYIKLTIDAPGKTLTGLKLREAGGGEVIWDTTQGNKTWLIVATISGRVQNKADGTLAYQLGQGPETLDLWVEDNHTLERGKKRLELVILLRDTQPLVLPL
jgi:hypothetical protein